MDESPETLRELAQYLRNCTRLFPSPKAKKAYEWLTVKAAQADEHAAAWEADRKRLRRCGTWFKNKWPATTWRSTPCWLIMLPGRRLPRRIDEGPTRPDTACAPEELSEMLPEGWVMVLKNRDGFGGDGRQASWRL